MKKPMLLICCLLLLAHINAQQAPILDISTRPDGRVEITVASTEDHYYVLHVRHDQASAFEQATAIQPGVNGSIHLTEPLAAYPLAHYRVTEHLLSNPADTDGDGKNDLEELADLNTYSPFNVAKSIDFHDGTVCIPDRATFKKLSFTSPDTGDSTTEIVKFFIHNRDEAEPELFFINSNTHELHTEFAHAIGYTNDGTLLTGTIAFHPFVMSPNGSLGVYRFFFHANSSFPLAYIRKAMELLAANMPFLRNNLCYYPLEPVGLSLYWEEKEAYDASRVSVLFEADLFENLDYQAYHVAEGFGLLRQLLPGETPHGRDIVVCETLPNELPRVAGMITSVMQTPLSHVNLRAIQDRVPNAFIRNALDQPGIDTLLDKYVYYKADRLGFIIREATLSEVEAFFKALQPAHPQKLVRDLSMTRILPLDSIQFGHANSFGVKCANVATMRRFGFAEGVIPDGFGIPFYFYDAFMQYNGFYNIAKNMLDTPEFQTDYDVQEAQLAWFRQLIIDATMPDWMMEALGNMQQSFPEGTSIRCRSSTNNEDLPGFSGAGLYDSKTQKPSEGHIAKSIKEVFASLWNFRAFNERSFNRVDHFTVAMGILVHPNFKDEKANGVGVSTDPFYQTEGTYYLNTQLGEDLVTNPTGPSTPEEILLDVVQVTEDDFIVMSASNLLPHDSLIMSAHYLDQMRQYLGVIHEQFKVLYNAEKQEDFAMEVEYKIDANNVLTIKQARPWVSFQQKSEAPPQPSAFHDGFALFPNPAGSFVFLQSELKSALTVHIYTLLGQKIADESIDLRKSRWPIAVGHLSPGVYILSIWDKDGHRLWSSQWIKG
ncbi:MAG: T9SS type A sorting domain-containing protein [Chitinophagales bacterium]|nr:T9SS type A sorting domain-containing protein [Chitinophagales bacterium]